MRIRVKLFATLGRGRDDISPAVPFEMELGDGATVDVLVSILNLPREEVRVAYVNGRARPPEWVLQPGDEVGIFPAVGGG